MWPVGYCTKYWVGCQVLYNCCVACQVRYRLSTGLCSTFKRFYGRTRVFFILLIKYSGTWYFGLALSLGIRSKALTEKIDFKHLPLWFKERKPCLMWFVSCDLFPKGLEITLSFAQIRMQTILVQNFLNLFSDNILNFDANERICFFLLIFQLLHKLKKIMTKFHLPVI